LRSTSEPNGRTAHDLVYCLQYAIGGPEAVAAEFRAALATKHKDVIERALGILARRFTDDQQGEGYRKDGPVAVARFEGFTDDDDDGRERRLLRQRQATEIVSILLSRVHRDG
jgi:hypothetical protein